MNDKQQISGIPASDREFTANGKKYFVMDKIPVARWKEYEKLVPRLTFGLGFKEMFGNLKKLYAELDKQRFANAAVICHNLMNGIATVNDEKRIEPVLLMAALLINREDEDPKVYDEKIMLEKIEDWTAEGLDIGSFFSLCLNSIDGFTENYKEYTEATTTIPK